jgi:Fe-S-cluster-containing hydrogenase component 2
MKKKDEMDTETQIYHELQKHLEGLPTGLSATDSGIEIHLLRHLFTPEEAKIAIQLSMKPEPIKNIFKGIEESGMSIEKLQQRLDQMVYKGIVRVNQEGYKEKHYSNAGFDVGGIYYFQVERLTEDLINDYHQYLDKAYAAKAKAVQEKIILPLRTIPKIIAEKSPVSDYDDVRKIIENASGPIAVANCICRQSKDLLGEVCDMTHLRETCLMIGPDRAKQYVDMGIGRFITKEEACDILQKAQEAGLVIQAANSQQPDVIHCCCGDCCLFLKSLKQFPRPGELYVTNYYVEINPELCLCCGGCVRACPMGAMALVNRIPAVNLDRCIGCGSCILACGADVFQLKRKGMGAAKRPRNPNPAPTHRPRPRTINRPRAGKAGTRRGRP